MKLLGVLPFARELLMKAVTEGDVVIDATAGKGNDTLFLSKLVSNTGKVYSFDIQEAAITATRKKLAENNQDSNVQLIHDGHEKLLNYLDQDDYENIAGAIFNLGYLPGSDKTVVTTPETTIKAIEHIIKHLKVEGILVLVVYHGHAEGKVEKDALIPFIRALPQEHFHVLEYQFTNQINNPPFIIAIEKRG
ncbi:class I SAM-dependent methyltransferase [Evansella cellulosilytica]|nr:class I SAM-dependent methyltransferase [Evansella cellulosilytica]